MNKKLMSNIKLLGFLGLLIGFVSDLWLRNEEFKETTESNKKYIDERISEIQNQKSEE